MARKKKFQMKYAPTEPQRLESIPCETTVLGAGEEMSLQSLLARCSGLPADAVLFMVDYYPSLILRWTERESEEDFQKRMGYYHRDLVIFEKWQADNAEEIKVFEEKEAQKELKQKEYVKNRKLQELDKLERRAKRLRKELGR